MPRTDKLSAYCTAWARKPDGELTVTYHQTVVVETFPEAIVLNTGGWDTVTTRRKMNQAANQFGLDYRVFRDKGDTFVSWRGRVYPFDEKRVMLMKSGEARDYETGITLSPRG